MPLPVLTPGLVVRYEYLWRRRSDTAGVADKDHPACVVATYRREGVPGDFVVYLPISHTPPSSDQVGVELPDEVKRRAGLDSLPQWILVSECNIDRWPMDLRVLPNQPGVFHYGHLPPGMFNVVRDRFVALHRARQIKPVDRTSA